MFASLVNDGVISKDQLRRSVALVAISGNDYLSGADVDHAHLSSFSDVSNNRSSTSHLTIQLLLQMNTYIAGVTSEIVKNVERLQRLGLRKVIVNNLHPIGCTPLQSRSNNYSSAQQQPGKANGQEEQRPHTRPLHRLHRHRQPRLP
jgi:hypothetical protein